MVTTSGPLFTTINDDCNARRHPIKVARLERIDAKTAAWRLVRFWTPVPKLSKNAGFGQVLDTCPKTVQNAWPSHRFRAAAQKPAEITRNQKMRWCNHSATFYISRGADRMVVDTSMKQGSAGSSLAEEIKGERQPGDAFWTLFGHF